MYYQDIASPYNTEIKEICISNLLLNFLNLLNGI